MRLVFVHYVIPDRGSAQDMHNYAQVARALGHEVVVYGPPSAESAFDYSLQVDPADAVIFIFEWTTALQHGDNVDFVRLLGRVTRNRRIVIDCDGGYNDAIGVVGDVNHPDAEASRRWVEICDSLSDTVLQPSYHPRRPNVRPFFFHAYNPDWERPLEFGAKEFGMVYVGNNWFRWRALRSVLAGVEPIREQVGRIGLIGEGWNSPAPWGGPMVSQDAYYTDPSYLERLGVEVHPPVRFDRVIDCMGRGVFTPVIYRPLFDHLRLVTCRTFETPAAGTIPLFAQDPAFVAEIYGEQALALVLTDYPSGQILNVVRQPERYAPVVAGIRRHLAASYSYAGQLGKLIDIVES